MSISVRIQRTIYALVALTTVAGTLGGGCEFNFPVIVVPDGPDPVVIQLINDSSSLVGPSLWADPDTEFITSEVARDENLIDIGDPLIPGEIVTITLECIDAGTLFADADLADTPIGDLNGNILLREGEHFVCGDTIRYHYVDRPVTVELRNTTSNDVDAFLWADPDLLSDPVDVAIPANLIDVGEPLIPDETATVILDCIDAGTLLADGDLLLEPAGDPLASENLVLVRDGEHYVCGDIVSFYYEVDGGGGFFITVDVNDVTIPF